MHRKPTQIINQRSLSNGETLTMTTKDMKVSSTGGLRYNKGKHRPSVVPTSLSKAVATVIHKSSTEGGGKYPMHNWRKGLPWTDVADSAMRHIQDFLDRKDIDKESGLHTLYHAATNLAFLIEYLCLLYTSPSPRDRQKSRMPSS